MPTFRPDLDTIPRYIPGKPVEEVARELGIDSIDKLASNECPEPPFPEVLDAINGAAADVNRYPDSSGFAITRAIGSLYDIDPSNIWAGAGSSELLRCMALSVGGPGTSFVFATPSCVMYIIGARISGSEPIMVPLTASFDHDLEAMADAIRDDTSLVFVCNPNNPTGNIRSADDVRAFIDSVPERVTVVIVEAYAEYVTDPSYATMIPEALDRPNVVVARTFSKIYGLAGLRVGYVIGDADLLLKLRTTQAPFSVNSVAQLAAIEAIKHQGRVKERRDANATGRDALTAGLTERGFAVAPSQANFVYLEPDGSPAELADALMQEGVIVRPLGPGLRISVGTPDENVHFFTAWDSVMAHA